MTGNSVTLYRVIHSAPYCGEVWFRHCATSPKVAGSIPDWVIDIFRWLNPSGHAVALGWTQPVTEMTYLHSDYMNEVCYKDISHFLRKFSYWSLIYDVFYYFGKLDLYFLSFRQHLNIFFCQMLPDIRKSFALFEGSQASPACLSDKNNLVQRKVKPKDSVGCETCITATFCLFTEEPRSRCYRHTAALRLIVQPCDEDDSFFFHFSK